MTLCGEGYIPCCDSAFTQFVIFGLMKTVRKVTKDQKDIVLE